MNDPNILNLYPLTILSDRYGGTYSGWAYLAFNLHSEDVPIEPSSNDVMCAEFWDGDQNGIIIGRGHTPNEAWIDLHNRILKA